MRFTAKVLVGRPQQLLLNDCACPSTTKRCQNTYEENYNTSWYRSNTIYQQPISTDYDLFCSSFGTANVALLNRDAMEVLNSFTKPRLLGSVYDHLDLALGHIESVLQTIIELGLIVPVETRQATSTASFNELVVWLHITNACNLRCTYCYINKDKTQMTAETAKDAVDAIFRTAVQHGFESIQLKYAGGEPTLNPTLIRLVHERAVHLSTITNIAFHETVLSNGVFLPEELLDYFRDEQIGLMISLDGLGEDHDRQRPLLQGAGSVNRVIASVDQALKQGVKPHLSITVSGRNADSLPDVVAFALDRDLRFNLNFYRESDCSASVAELRNDQQQLIDGMLAAFKVIEERLPRQRLIDSLLDRSSFHSPHTHACGAGHNYLVIGHHGDVAKCQMEIEQPITNIYVEDPLSMIQQDYSTFRNISVDEKEGCRDCSWRYWCAGGCSLLTMRATGRTDVKSPYCEVYKVLYPEVLRLEGLRLLKWGSD